MPYDARGHAGALRRGFKGAGVKELLAAGLFTGALALANGLASSYPAPRASHDSPRVHVLALERWQEEHVDHYARLRPLLFEEQMALSAMCAR
jgi:hypothetical protein